GQPRPVRLSALPRLDAQGSDRGAPPPARHVQPEPRARPEPLHPLTEPGPDVLLQHPVLLQTRLRFAGRSRPPGGLPERPGRQVNPDRRHRLPEQAAVQAPPPTLPPPGRPVPPLAAHHDLLLRRPHRPRLHPVLRLAGRHPEPARRRLRPRPVPLHLRLHAHRRPADGAGRHAARPRQRALPGGVRLLGSAGAAGRALTRRTMFTRAQSACNTRDVELRGYLSWPQTPPSSWSTTSRIFASSCGSTSRRRATPCARPRAVSAPSPWPPPNDLR